LTTSAPNRSTPWAPRWLLAAGVLVLASLAAAWWIRPERPNVVIVVLDTLRPDHLGCYGYGRDTSPNIDAFAAESVVFETAESVSPWTAPAMISLVTSLHPEAHGVYRFPNPGRLNENATTLAEVLRSHGYATAAFTEGGYAKPEFGLDQGIDVFPRNEGDDESHMSNMEHGSRIVANVDRALAWLDAQSGPYFMLFHTYEVHEPLRAPDDFVRRYRPGWVAEAEDARLQEVFDRFVEAGEITREGFQLAIDHGHHCAPEYPPKFQFTANERGLVPEGGAFNEATIQFFRDLYDAEIRFMDRELARLLEAIDDGAIVVIVSDHGEALGEHDLFNHGRNYHTEQIGVALIVRAPGLEPRRVGELVRSIDVMPTVLELTGVRPDELLMQGRTLGPLLRGEPDQPRVSFSHGRSVDGYELHMRSMRVGPWRYIHEQGVGGQLYDLEADPGETRDVSAEHPAEARMLHGRLRDRRELDEQWRALQTGEVERDDLTPETLQDLEKLGYIEETP
jgi:arylsulfatase A-like enzyme